MQRYAFNIAQQCNTWHSWQQPCIPVAETARSQNKICRALWHQGVLPTEIWRPMNALGEKLGAHSALAASTLLLNELTRSASLLQSAATCKRVCYQRTVSLTSNQKL